MASLASWLMLIVSAGFMLPAMAAAAPPSTAGSRGTLLIVNKGDQTLGIVDPAAGKEVATVKLSGFTGHEVAASPDGKLAYVPIYGNSGVGSPGTNGDSVDVIDIASRKIVHIIKMPSAVRPHCAIYAPDGMLYVSSELSKSVDIINPKTNEVVGSIPTEQKESHMIALTTNGEKGYTANVGAGTVTALDITGRRAITVIPVAKTVQRISVSENNRWAFTTDQHQPRLAVIDTRTNKVSRWVPLPGIGFGSRATLDGKYELVTIPNKNLIAVVNLRTMKVVRSVEVPSAPQEIVLNPAGKLAYVSCDRSRQIAVLNLDNWKVDKLIQAGRNCDGMAWASAQD
ncbi:MAG TPA: YncE family protein [Terriglobia bacterium]|nr:YncE family protein [Terriglobia bacterium]